LRWEHPADRWRNRRCAMGEEESTDADDDFVAPERDFRKAMWEVWSEDLGEPACKLSVAASKYGSAVEAGEEGLAAVRWTEVLLSACRLEAAWRPWLGLGWTIPSGFVDCPRVIELHEAACAVFAGNPRGLDDVRAEARAEQALERLRRAALALWE
jgi:hypothetical protein